MTRLAGLLLFACGCSTTNVTRTETPCCSTCLEETADGIPLTVTVSAWVAYEHDGERFIHLWSPGAPKSVFVVRESDVAADFLATLERELPMTHALKVTVHAAHALTEAPTYVDTAAVSGLVQYRQDPGYGAVPVER